MNHQPTFRILLCFLISFAGYPNLVAAGGGMEFPFPFEMSLNFKDALIPRPRLDPSNHVTCEIWRFFDSRLVPLPDMVILGDVDFTAWPEAECPSAKFEQVVKDLCIESNLKEFKCETDERGVTHIKMTIRNTRAGEDRLPRDCFERAINKFMEVDDQITCSDTGW